VSVEVFERLPFTPTPLSINLEVSFTLVEMAVVVLNVERVVHRVALVGNVLPGELNLGGRPAGNFTIRNLYLIPVTGERHLGGPGGRRENSRLRWSGTITGALDRMRLQVDELRSDLSPVFFGEIAQHRSLEARKAFSGSIAWVGRDSARIRRKDATLLDTVCALEFGAHTTTAAVRFAALCFLLHRAS
jgi:hypothetical protein